MGGCFRYVQIHVVVAEAHDKSIVGSAGGEGNQRQEMRVESLAAISRVPLLWDVVSGALKCASDHRFRYFLTLTFLFNKIRGLSRQDCIRHAVTQCRSKR
jgi:hypothetical protein